ncbi:MAG TPA: hypothetical protein VIL48_15470 [Acidimicrobiales bacterium]
MRRLPRILAAVVGVAVALAVGNAGPAAGRDAQAGAAPPPDEVARAIAAAGWYGQEGAVDDRRPFEALADRLTGQAEPIGFALLAAEPRGSSTTYAEQVLDALIDQGEREIRTVVALSDADVGVVSDAWSDQAIDVAVDQAIDDLRADPATGLESLARTLASQPTGVEETDAPEDDGGGTNPVLVGLGVVGIAGLAIAGRVFGWSRPRDLDDDEYRRRRRWRRSAYRSRRRVRPTRSRSRSSSRSSRRGRGGRRL